MNQIILETKEISKSFGEVKALNNVNFYLHKGKIHGLLGENGAGKSSLMNILSGIYQPEKGSIIFEGNTLSNLTPDSAMKLGIGMVHQEFRLIESFSIKDNLTLSKSNIYVENFNEAYSKYSDIFSLSVSSEQIISSLSVGEKQKIEIMKLIFNNSKIMLLDEPTAVLTPQETNQLKSSLERLSKEDGKTIVFITHDLDESLKLGDHIGILNGGRLVQVGKPEEIIMNPADDYVAAFVKDVNRAKVLRAKTIMLSAEQNPLNGKKSAETLKVNENSFVEEFLPIVLEQHSLVEVIDKQGNTMGFITEKEIAKSLSKSKQASF